MTGGSANVLMINMVFLPYFGGAVFQAIHLAKALKKRGLRVEFLVDNGNDGSRREDYEDIAINRLRTFVQEYASKFRELIFSLRVLWFVICHPEFQILHFHSVRGFETLLFPIYKALGKKIVFKVTLAGSDDPLTLKSRKLLGSLYFFGLNFVDRMVVISKKLMDLALSSGIPLKKVSLIFNGVDDQQFNLPTLDEKNELRRTLGLPLDKVIFLSTGKVEARKGYDQLIRAYRLIVEKYADAQLLILGPGNSEDNMFYRHLLAYLKSENLNSVQFLGFKSNVRDYMKAGDCFLFCSNQEGFGTVLIEAMACGLPTIAMDIPGITQDIILSPDIGRIAPLNDLKAFAGQVGSILEARDPVKINAASDQIRERFSIKAIADQYIQLYDELMKNESSSSCAVPDMQMSVQTKGNGIL